MKNGHGLDLAVIGNSRTAALVDPDGRIVWWCFPRLDGDPVFSRLLAGDEEKGFTDVVLDDIAETRSEYLRNTATVVTTLADRHGNAVRITDFAPRFFNFGRVFRPPQLMRIIEPVSGLPRIVIRFRPTFDYGRSEMARAFGSSHIRYSGGSLAIRLSTDAPLSYIDREAPFVLTRPLYLVLGPDAPFESDMATTVREFCARTRDFWLEWVRRLAISYDWQDEIIRAAITLKLTSFEETGAVVAALTTSIPEAAGSGRTWDYRYCWLRDAYFVVRALNRIGATHAMEEFISYILSIATEEGGDMRPVYSVVAVDPMQEQIVPTLKGFRGDGPVRIGNEAADQAQHDTYGSVILAATPMFFDRRLPRMGDDALFRRLEPLGQKAYQVALTPDAGIWEYRGRTRIHTYSASMCWAGVHRLEAVARHLGFHDRAAIWEEKCREIQDVLLERAWNPRREAFTAAFGSDELDASVLLMPTLGVVEPNDPRFISTVNAIERELRRGHHVMRYTSADDFGIPQSAFLVCRFWLIDALWLMGREDEARDLLVDALKLRNRYGLLSEDVEPNTGALWGNFPQTYSMAGLILSAIRLSRSWEDRFWRGSS